MKLSRDFHKNFFDFINIVPKRIRIVMSVFIMTSLILFSTFFEFASTWWFFTVIFIITSYALTYVSVLEEIEGAEWFTLFVMPVLFTLAFYFFFTLLPSRWIARLPYIAFFAFGFYALLLTSNIFNVGVEKSLQLYRAAFSVNYLFQTLMIFLFMQVILTYKQSFLLNSFIAFLVSAPMAVQVFWSVNPDSVLKKGNLAYGLLLGMILFQGAMLLSFIPFKSSVAALVLTAGYYSLSGIMYHHVDLRLFKTVVREYTFVLIFVSAIALLTLQW